MTQPIATKDHRSLVAGALGCAVTLLCLMASPVVAQGGPESILLDQPFPYAAKSVTIEAMLQDMSRKTSVPVISAMRMTAQVDVENTTGRMRDVLNDLSGRGLILWWFDGVAVHVEPPTAMTSKLIALQGIDPADLRDQVSAVWLDNPDYPIIGQTGAPAVRLVAPAGYIAAVEELIGAMAESRKARSRDLPIVIRGSGRPRQQPQPILPPGWGWPNASGAQPARPSN